MKTIALLAPLLLAACGPDLSTVVDTYTVEGITIRSERPITRTWVDHDARMVRRVLDEVGLVASSSFAARFGDLTIVVRDTYDLEGGEGGIATVGMHHARGLTRWVELSRDGTSLGHELMHEIGGCSHNLRNVWACPEYQAAEEEFDTYALRWDL